MVLELGGGPDRMAPTQTAPKKDGPPTSNGHSAPAKPSGSGGPSTPNGSTTAQVSPVKDQPHKPTEHAAPAKPSTDKPEGGISQAKPPTSGGHPTSYKPREPVPALPSRRLKIKERVDALLEAAVRSNGDARDHRRQLFDLSELDDAICEWDEDVVELIVDSPAVLSGYRIGKALSLTQWKIRVAKQWNRGDADLSVDPWNEAFRKERVEEIQRHVSALSTVLDPRAVAAVTTGLGYWRNALLSLTSNGRFSGERSWWRNALLRLASTGGPAGEGARSSHHSSTIAVSSKHGEKLLTALEEQVANWLDLLTGRRPPRASRSRASSPP